MTDEKHIERNKMLHGMLDEQLAGHKALHDMLDKIFADYTLHGGGRASNAIMNLLTWNASQMNG